MTRRTPRSRTIVVTTVLAAVAGGADFARAAPPAPTGPHPRIALDKTVLATLKAKAPLRESAMSAAIAACRKVDLTPGSPSGYQGDAWAFGASACALAYQITGAKADAARGIALWRALLEDVARLGDKKACVASASPEQAVAAIRRDTGYAIRFIGPHAALAYDWLHDAPGVDEALRRQSRGCFRAWLDWYAAQGYLNSEPGSNYHAGYVLTKTLVAIATSGEASPNEGAGQDLWTEVVDDVFARQIVAKGLAADNRGVPRGDHHGVLVGGDWPEGWQYGPLSVMEYALAARALQEHGSSWPELRGWSDDLTLRFMHGLAPAGDRTYAGGDAENEHPDVDPSPGPLLATLLGPSSERAAGWAAFLRRRKPDGGRSGVSVFDVLAEARVVAPVDPLSTDPPRWLLARGTRNLYARSGWGPDAFWTVLTSAPRLVSDHQHMDASGFVFSRGRDPLIVDPSPYGSRSSLTGNALTVDSNVVLENYKPSQTPWSTAELPWVRGTKSGVVAARADISGAFNFTETPSDVPLARRDWVFLPEGELVVIDRVRTGDPARGAYLRFRTPATLSLAGGVARGTSGASALAIHAVALAPAGAPRIKVIPHSAECNDKAFGACTAARFSVGEYALELKGPEVLAIHVLDGLGRDEAPAVVTSMTAAGVVAATAPDQNRAVVGASVERAAMRTFVVAAAAASATPAETLGYSVPGAAPARHVVFDAPEDGEGRAAVSATASPDGRCQIKLLAAGPLMIAGRPVIFSVGPAAGGCRISLDPGVGMGGGGVVTPPAPPRSKRGGTGLRRLFAHARRKKRPLAAALAVAVAGVTVVAWRSTASGRRRP